MREQVADAARAAVASRWWYPTLGACLAVASLVDAALLNDPPSATSILLALTVCVDVGLCGRLPVAAPIALVALFGAQVLPVLTDAAPDVSFVAPAIAAYVVAAHAGRLTAIAALVLLTASLEIVTIPTGEWVPSLYLPLGPWVIGTIVRSRRRLVTELEDRTVQLEDEREAFARLAARRERARIARELHDIVSHNMAVMVVQAGAGRIAPPADPEQVAEIFRGIRAAGGAALAEMDQLVDVLGLHTSEPLAGATLANVPELVNQVRSAGLDITAELSVHGSGIPVEVEQAAYRAIQEGLTNILKHAPASRVELRLDAREEKLEIEVRNTGAASQTATLADTGSGLGLPGINERIRASGGELSAGPLADGGWHFTVRMPTRPAPQPRSSGTSQG